jgi:hypothetical protein
MNRGRNPPRDAVSPAPAGFGVEVSVWLTSEPHALQGAQGLAEGLYLAVAGTLTALNEAQLVGQVLELAGTAQTSLADHVYQLEDVIDAGNGE